jgi:hypothetical protein
MKISKYQKCIFVIIFQLIFLNIDQKWSETQFLVEFILKILIFENLDFLNFSKISDSAGVAARKCLYLGI